MLRFDLQCHSTASDGVLPPARVVAAAAAAGVELLALTDHDTVAGVAEAAEAAAASGVRLVPATEISTVTGPVDLHVCGYGIDPASAALDEALADWRRDRQDRVLRMADRLRELGWALDDAEIERRRLTGEPIGRPHVAQAAWGHPDNQARLREEGYVTRNAFFGAHLVPDGLAWVPRTRPTVPDAIEVIHAAGGVAIWAHPFHDVAQPERVAAFAEGFFAQGLDGLECFYPSHDESQTRFLHELCADRLATGSSDVHDPVQDAFLAFETYDLEPRLGPIEEAP